MKNSDFGDIPVTETESRKFWVITCFRNYFETILYSQLIRISQPNVFDRKYAEHKSSVIGS